MGIVTARYVWPELHLRPGAEALRPLLMLHSLRFIGLAFLIPGVPGQLGAACFIPTFVVPLLLITHGLAFRILVQHQNVPAVQKSRLSP